MGLGVCAINELDVNSQHWPKRTWGGTDCSSKLLERSRTLAKSAVLPASGGPVRITVAGPDLATALEVGMKTVHVRYVTSKAE